MQPASPKTGWMVRVHGKTYWVFRTTGTYGSPNPLPAECIGQKMFKLFIYQKFEVHDLREGVDQEGHLRPD